MTIPSTPTAAAPARRTSAVQKPLVAGIVMLALLAVLWILEVVDQLSGNRLDALGIRAREVDGLPEVFTAPWLHYGWAHLAANSIPFFVLGFLVLIGGLSRFLVTTFVVIVTSGLVAWGLTSQGTLVLGASGLIFGWLTYLLARGVFARSLGQIAIALVVLLLYGGVLWGIFPSGAGISWQAHLGGAIGGVLSAWLLHRRDRGRATKATSATAFAS